MLDISNKSNKMYLKFVIVILSLFVSLAMCRKNENYTHSQHFKNKAALRTDFSSAAKPGDVPFQISFKKYLIGGQEGDRMSSEIFINFCMGTLVAANKIISAAHCFTAERSVMGKFFNVNFKAIEFDGIWAVSSYTFNLASPYDRSLRPPHIQWREIASCVFPLNYRFPKHDIAAVFTKQPFDIDPFTQFVSYARETWDYTKLYCSLVNFGVLNEEDDEYLARVVKDRTIVMSKQDCNDMYETNMDRFLCPVTLRGSFYPQGSLAGGAIMCYDKAQQYPYTTPPEDLRQGRNLDLRDAGPHGLLVGVGTVMANEIIDIGMGPIYTRILPYHQFLDNNRGCGVRISVWLFVILIFVI